MAPVHSTVCIFSNRRGARRDWAEDLALWAKEGLDARFTRSRETGDSPYDRMCREMGEDAYLESSTDFKKLWQSDIHRWTRTLRGSREFARFLDPTVSLDRIPRHKRGPLIWVNETEMHHPDFGTLAWVGKGKRPITPAEIDHCGMFICRGCIAPTVQEVVIESKGKWGGKDSNVKWEEDGSWRISLETHELWSQEMVKNAKKEWEARVPEAYGREDLLSLDYGEVFSLIAVKKMTKEEFWEWLDQRAWDRSNEDLSKDCARLALDEAWPTLSAAARI